MATYNPGAGDIYKRIIWNYRQERGVKPDGSIRYHDGIDIPAIKYTVIPVAADGKVVYSGVRSGYGNTTVIEHTGADGTKFYTLYAHMANPGLPVGTELSKGHVIGFVGNTGTKDIHLHFEILEQTPVQNGRWILDSNIGRVNPKTFNNWPITGAFDYKNDSGLLPPLSYEPGPFPHQSLNSGSSNVLDKLMSFIEGTAHAAEVARRVDPLILDLDNDGIETTNVKEGAYFDHDGNGFAEQTGWTGSDDGLLVMDRNNNGTIDNGTELFGDQTILQNGQRATDGFQALAELDSNSDGVIDINDTAFSNLRIWQDIDGDGTRQPWDVESPLRWDVGRRDLSKLLIIPMNTRGEGVCSRKI